MLQQQQHRCGMHVCAAFLSRCCQAAVAGSQLTFHSPPAIPTCPPACSTARPPADPRQQKRQRKQSKEQLLATAVEKVAAASELGATQEGKAQLAKEAWGTALQRAKGDKVLDDPRLLKRSMKKVGGWLGGWLDGWMC